MPYANVKLEPEVHERLEQEVEQGTWDSVSAAVRHYIDVGMERDTQLRERVDELQEDKEEWRAQARSLMEKSE
jgi:Arc/MetJ-type ribon-helix-helix transcriptional regulator